jgi:hypothetical protein
MAKVSLCEYMFCRNSRMDKWSRINRPILKDLEIKVDQPKSRSPSAKVGNSESLKSFREDEQVCPCATAQYAKSQVLTLKNWLIDTRAESSAKKQTRWT